jgi:arylsulfatase A-like enzyme
VAIFAVLCVDFASVRATAAGSGFALVSQGRHFIRAPIPVRILQSRRLAPKWLVSSFLGQWFLITAAAALIVSAVDAALLQRSRSLFTGGFLSVNHLDTIPQVAAFAASSLMIDAAVAGLLAAVAMLGLASLKARRVAVIAGGLMAAIGPLVIANVIAYQLVRYLGDAFDIGLMFDLTGRSIAEMFAVSSAHVAMPALLIAASSVAAAGAIWVLNRTSGPVAVRPALLRSLTVPLMVALLAAVTLYAAASSSDALANGLLRKPSGRVLAAAINVATDVDRDGYGLIGNFADPDPFDAAVSPYAPDLPGNGVDENGVGGDLPSEAPRYLEHAVYQTGWQRKPDVVLIVLESFRADLVGARHDGLEITPVLNRLAEAGISSAQAYSHNGYTVQSRYHMLAGTLTARVGANTLIDDFKSNGYVVGYFSGQDESFGAEAYRVGFERADTAYDARSDASRRYSTYSTPGSLAIPLQALLDNLDAFVSARSGDARPMFLYINFEDTHFPYSHEGIETLVSKIRLPRQRIAPENRNALWATYVNTAANVDRAVGRVIEGVGKARGTPPAVVVTADHGESLYEEGFLGHGYGLNDVQTRVPFIAAGLPIRIQEPFAHLDLRAAITQALTLPASVHDAPEVVPTERPVLQYLGDLRRPRQVAFTHGGRRFIYDFRAERVQVWDGAWRAPATLTGEDRAVFQRLIHQWEWINLSLRRGPPGDVE